MKETKEITSPVKAIRAYCLDCSNDQYSLVASCNIPTCPLYAFRFGKNPFNKRTLTDEQSKASAERLRKYHLDKKAKK